MRKIFVVLFVFCCTVGIISWGLWNEQQLRVINEWREYLGGPDRNHYSLLTQIDSTNVQQLKIAWVYKTGDSGQMQCNPIIVNGILYGMNASTQAFAIDAASGKEVWKWRSEDEVMFNTSRGVTYWEKGDDGRILFTNGSWLYAVDAKTGKPIPSFGTNGRVDLKEGLGISAAEKFVVSNTPGTVYEDLIIMPLRVSEGADAAIGNIQAFNIETGKLAWVFHTIPRPGEYGYNSWTNKDAYKNINIGGVNNWSGMAIDRKRGIVYVPTGSAAFDYYGGNRKGNNLFANCLLALDAKTGQRKWHYQMVHHDILDRDPPAAPNLITIMQNHRKIDAVAQVTKQGMVFVFDRETGKPLFQIEERKTPPSAVPGEQASPTQPFAIRPVPYARHTLTENDISPYAENKSELRGILKRSGYKGPFTPLSQTGTLVFPGLDGGAEWGGAAADPDGIIYINSSEMAWLLKLGPAQTTRENGRLISPGRQVYVTNCMACHGGSRNGNAASGFPSLINLASRHDRSYAFDIVSHGKGMMPAFPTLSSTERQAVISYLFGDEKKATSAPSNFITSKEPGINQTKKSSTAPYKTAPYKITGFSKFLDSKGMPAIAPPWGTLNAINLNTGEYLWKVPFGTYPELMEKGIPQTGAESYGGPVITASGLLFIGATKDKKFRVYNKRNGVLLWQTDLPAAGFATPSTYEVAGKQYIVIACGGEKLGASKGDSYVAFALP